MQITNINYEFLIESSKGSSGTNFSLAKTKRKYFRLDSRAVEEDKKYCNRYVSLAGLNINLEILEGEFYNQYFFDNTDCISKKSFLIFKNKTLIGIYENHTRFMGEYKQDWVHFFVKKMNLEEIRLTLEHTLSIQLGSELLPTRDRIIEYISCKPSTSFKRV